MEAIEIYSKVLEVVKDEDFQDVCAALDFVRRKVEQDHWKQQESGQIYGGGLIGAASAKRAQMYDPDETRAILKQVVQEELASQTAIAAE